MAILKASGGRKPSVANNATIVCSNRGLTPPARLLSTTLRKLQANLLALLGLAGLVFLLFRQFILGRAVYIGNSDRLNTYLNVLRFQVDGIRAGHLTAWNESLFGGTNSFGLAYTFPNPLTFLLKPGPHRRTFSPQPTWYLFFSWRRPGGPAMHFFEASAAAPATHSSARPFTSLVSWPSSRQARTI